MDEMSIMSIISNICFLIFGFVLLGTAVVSVFGIDVSKDIEVVKYPDTELGHFCEVKSPTTFDDYKRCNDIRIVSIKRDYNFKSIRQLIGYGFLAFLVLLFIAFIGYALFYIYRTHCSRRRKR